MIILEDWMMEEDKLNLTLNEAAVYAMPVCHILHKR